ncbi:hypothetical protein MTO96_047621 [Rhipicephalus appendiculatus]
MVTVSVDVDLDMKPLSLDLVLAAPKRLPFDAAYAREKVRISSGGRPSSFCYIDERRDANVFVDDGAVVEIQTEGCEIEVESEVPSPAASPLPDPCSPESVQFARTGNSLTTTAPLQTIRTKEGAGVAMWRKLT